MVCGWNVGMGNLSVTWSSRLSGLSIFDKVRDKVCDKVLELLACI
jgi:hypothetical protein